ncbi:hypothetical protein SAMN04488065_1242 [Haloplanus vescus]|uniref:Uncharacterized protein n=1 Tax=Haloplanus vescus TaxID=555874 RepID=A0A1H3WYZ5_9EURY|nr:lipase chaperone [Haloplanus vescus]SDZ92319.1 hypothetical protein SAMN04488065_1242 [Haloplanus vescus]
MRAQTNLFALVVALLLLTGVTVIGVSVADAALTDATGDPRDRHAATAVADRLVAADAPVTVRANALDSEAVDTLDASLVETLAPPAADADFRITLDGAPVVERGSPDNGVTVRRSVVVVNRSARSRAAVDVARESTVSVPQGVGRVAVSVDPGSNGTITTVRANDRVVLHDDTGLDTNATVHLSRYASTPLRVEATENATGRVTVTYRRQTNEPRVLRVTVDV